MLEYLKLAAQITIAISIYNVWFLRFNKSTIYRGKDAKNMKDEFISYGLKGPFVWIIGFLKVTLATMLIVGIFYDSLIFPAAVGMAVLMLGAILMHLKVKDQPLKSLPATIFLILSLSIAFL
ncbi:MAG: hypothetical protein CL853_03845 [Crocinitomicaceae bacterium]|nr:hypothetical protein [Crocinitomicaceae bacterium]|tara:strand:+ start:4886 stop:5251 length:366 start_codon:yes stop_codon:yes gene_type:complete